MHECIKSGFTTDNYSVDRPINFYLKQYDFDEFDVINFLSRI